MSLIDLHSFFVYVFFGPILLFPLTEFALRFFRVRDHGQRLYLCLLAMGTPLAGFILYETMLVKRCQTGFSSLGLAGWPFFDTVCTLGLAVVPYLGSAWPAIMGVAFLQPLLALWLVARLRRRAVLVSPRCRSRVKETVLRQSACLGLKAPEIIFSAREDFAAFTAGLLRPVIVTSASLPSRLSDSELTAVITHELVHISRGDTRKVWFWRLLRGAVFFSPLSGAFLARCLRENEQLCDRETAALCGGSREYAAALLKVWRLLAERKRFGIGLTTGLTGSKKEMEARIFALVSSEKSDGKIPDTQYVALAACLFTGTVLFLSMIC